MNRHHLLAFLWLRWRLRVNQLKRGGIANAVILAILAVGTVLLVAVLAGAGFVVGLFALEPASPAIIMYVWDGVVVAFLLFWAIGLLTELQRSEGVSLENFLHLPVSLTGAFLINYVSSLLSVNLILFVPAMVGLSVGLIFSKGPLMLLVLPLLAAFLLMVTAITYQFQGWLAALMVNPRRRRTVIVVATAMFVLVFQLPNLLNIIQPWKKQRVDEATARLTQEQAELQREMTAGKISPQDVAERVKEINQRHQEQVKEEDRQTLEQVEHVFRLANMVVPLGWLPLGAMAAAEGDVLPGLLGMLGLGLIGAACLGRAYQTTVRLYTGQFSSGEKRVARMAAPAKNGKPVGNLLEKKLPWVSEHAAVIALAGFKSLLRAPEAKMILLTPAILVIVFGSMFLTRSVDIPVMVRPLLSYAGMAMIMLTMIQLLGNQFGFDRNGFRVFVLCPARRREILLGKNLAVAPLALGLGALIAVFVEVCLPVRFDLFLASLVQLVAMYCLFCLMANLLSILIPMPIASGSLKPVNPKLIPILIQMVFIMLFPMALAPTLIPLGVEYLLDALDVVHGLPVCLVLSLVECAAVVWIYHLVLSWQGHLLQARERLILNTVTTKAE